MAVTNTDESAVDDSKTTDEEDLRALKYPKDDVEPSKEEDETSEEEDSQEESEEVEDEETSEEVGASDQEDEDSEDETEETPTFVKQFPNIKGDTPEEYLKNLEESYKHSTTEALRLKQLSEVGKSEDDEETSTGVVDPRLLYLDRIVEEDITKTYASFRKEYPQVDDPAEYEKFTTEVENLASYFINSKGTAATAKELYPKAAAILGWQKQAIDSKDKLGMALKNKAASTKTTSSTKPKAKQSKVSDKEVQMFRLMNPDTDLTDAKIREELEPFTA